MGTRDMGSSCLNLKCVCGQETEDSEKQYRRNFLWLVQSRTCWLACRHYSGLGYWLHSLFPSILLAVAHFVLLLVLMAALMVDAIRANRNLTLCIIHGISCDLFLPSHPHQMWESKKVTLCLDPLVDFVLAWEVLNRGFSSGAAVHFRFTI